MLRVLCFVSLMLSAAAVSLLPQAAWSALSVEEVGKLTRAAAAGDKSALSQMEKAAAQGDAGAQSNLGALYYAGAGVPKDLTKAAKLFRQAAEQGLGGAQNNLGLMYENGEGVPRDYGEAVKWYRLASKSEANASMAIARLYLTGQGVGKNEIEATKWVKKAAEGGDVNGEYSYGLMLLDGVDQAGVPRNYDEAKQWLKKAAAKGHQGAQVQIAEMEVPPNIQLLRAIEQDRKVAALRALGQGANVNAADPQGRTALGYAAINGQTDLVRELLKRGANVNAVSVDGITPLTSAVIFGDPEIVRALVEKGANVNAAEKNGETALSYAQSRLRNASADRPERGPRGMLSFAGKKDFEAVIKILTDAGATR